jgi:AAA domain
MSAEPLDPDYFERLLDSEERAAPTIGLDFVDWSDLFAGVTHESAILDGVAYRGRWTAYVAPGKAGKSTYTINLATELQRGRDPFDDAACEPVSVIYLDTEMGRVDMLERLEELELRPADLTRLHYTDLVPRLNTVEGSAQLLHDVERFGAGLVVVDGINGAVTGGENDDETWRVFYNLTIAPLKRAGVAIVTNDNLGKDKTLGPRGSSVKVDKPDAIIQMARTDHGIRLKTTHRRTAAYPLDVSLIVEGTDGSRPIRFRRAASSWPAGTAAKAAELDNLSVPIDVSNRAARAALRSVGQSVGNSEVLAAAIRYRKCNLQLVSS